MFTFMHKSFSRSMEINLGGGCFRGDVSVTMQTLINEEQLNDRLKVTLFELNIE